MDIIEELKRLKKELTKHPKYEVWVTVLVPDNSDDGEPIIVSMDVEKMGDIIPGIHEISVTGADFIIMMSYNTFNKVRDILDGSLLPVFTDEERHIH